MRLAARDDLHRFAPRVDSAPTFDVNVPDVDADATRAVIGSVDPLGGEPRADRTIRAPRLGPAESMRRWRATP